MPENDAADSGAVDPGAADNGFELNAVPVAPTEEVGSARLAEALAARDVPAIGQALRHDYVVVPVLSGQNGALLNRVFADGDSGGYEFCLFSSTATLAQYLADNDERQFALRRGSSLAAFLTEQSQVLTRVTFDPAGPYPMSASVDDVLRALQPQPGDDEVAWAASVGAPVRESGGLEDFPEGGDPTGSRAVGLDIALSGDWFVIALDDEKQRDAQIKSLVKKQLKPLASAPALRAELERWLRESCHRAAASGGRFLAYLLQRTADAALALNTTLYWHELGPAIGDQSHLERMTSKLRAGLGDGAGLVGATTQAGPFVRHSRIVAGASELGAGDVPLLVVDYWLEFPDKRGLCLITFSSPHVHIRDLLLTIMDNIVLTGAWVLETPVEAASGER